MGTATACADDGVGAAVAAAAPDSDAEGGAVAWQGRAQVETLGARQHQRRARAAGCRPCAGGVRPWQGHAAGDAAAVAVDTGAGAVP